jgi:hypothetical protein
MAAFFNFVEMMLITMKIVVSLNHEKRTKKQYYDNTNQSLQL